MLFLQEIENRIKTRAAEAVVGAEFDIVVILRFACIRHSLVDCIYASHTPAIRSLLIQSAATAAADLKKKLLFKNHKN